MFLSVAPSCAHFRLGKVRKEAAFAASALPHTPPRQSTHTVVHRWLTRTCHIPHTRKLPVAPGLDPLPGLRIGSAPRTSRCECAAGHTSTIQNGNGDAVSLQMPPPPPGPTLAQLIRGNVIPLPMNLAYRPMCSQLRYLRRPDRLLFLPFNCIAPGRLPRREIMSSTKKRWSLRCIPKPPSHPCVL